MGGKEWAEQGWLTVEGGTWFSYRLGGLASSLRLSNACRRSERCCRMRSNLPRGHEAQVLLTLLGFSVGCLGLEVGGLRLGGLGLGSELLLHVDIGHVVGEGLRGEGG